MTVTFSPSEESGRGLEGTLGGVDCVDCDRVRVGEVRVGATSLIASDITFSLALAIPLQRRRDEEHRNRGEGEDMYK